MAERIVVSESRLQDDWDRIEGRKRAHVTVWADTDLVDERAVEELRHVAQRQLRHMTKPWRIDPAVKVADQLARIRMGYDLSYELCENPPSPTGAKDNG